MNDSIEITKKKPESVIPKQNFLEQIQITDFSINLLFFSAKNNKPSQYKCVSTQLDSNKSY